ncbi:hypothetical protein [Telluribacter sp. SYSU D00476]|uniref:hypothetical protein n=1 Tax=Telluribacter sp. SYSU D00476 TaxID=2811430 RepID=UPI001FF291F2|nr:hypothetical protein [Telluribacter sp. SYSU D00476]
MRKLVFLVLLIPCIAYGQRSGSRKGHDIVSEANVILITSTLPDAEIYNQAKKLLMSNGMPVDSTVFGTDRIKTVLFKLNSNFYMNIRTGINEGVIRITGEAFDRFGTAFTATMASDRRGVSEAFQRMNYYALVLRDKLGSHQIEYRKE